VKKRLFIVLFTPWLMQADSVLSPINTFMNVFENNSSSDYKVFVGSGDSRFMLIHNTRFDLEQTHPQLSESIRVSDKIRIDLQAVTDDTKSIYVKFGGYASGKCDQGYEDGPFYIEMWLEYPDAPEINRDYVRYCQRGTEGRLGLRVNEAGEPEIFTVDNTIIVN
jgi:hypothetical protein